MDLKGIDTSNNPIHVQLPNELPEWIVSLRHLFPENSHSNKQKPPSSIKYAITLDNPCCVEEDTIQVSDSTIIYLRKQVERIE